MAPRGAIHHDHAVADLEDIGVLARLPAVEGFSVEEAHKTLFCLRRVGGQGAACQQQDQGGESRNFMEGSFSSRWLPGMPGWQCALGLIHADIAIYFTTSPHPVQQAT